MIFAYYCPYSRVGQAKCRVGRAHAVIFRAYSFGTPIVVHYPLSERFAGQGIHSAALRTSFSIFIQRGYSLPYRAIYSLFIQFSYFFVGQCIISHIGCLPDIRRFLIEKAGIFNREQYIWLFVYTDRNFI